MFHKQLMSIVLISVFAISLFTGMTVYAQDSTPMPTPIRIATATPTPELKSSIKVSDPLETTGYFIVVDEIVASQDGWIVVRAGIEEGEIVGWGYVERGKSLNYGIYFENSFVAVNGTRLVFLLLTDDGDGEFEYPESDDGWAFVDDNWVITTATVNSSIIPTPQATATSEPTPTVVTPSGYISMTSPQIISGDNGSLNIAQVSMPIEGWIVVRVLDGTIVGMTELNPGIQHNVPIRLEHTFSENTELIAQLYRDQGTLKEFDQGTDFPYFEADVFSVYVEVLVQGLEVNDQESVDGRSVVIDVIIANQKGWVSIHDLNQGSRLVGLLPVDAQMYLSETVVMTAGYEIPHGAHLVAILWQESTNRPARTGDDPIEDDFFVSRLAQSNPVITPKPTNSDILGSLAVTPTEPVPSVISTLAPAPTQGQNESIAAATITPQPLATVRSPGDIFKPLLDRISNIGVWWNNLSVEDRSFYGALSLIGGIVLLLLILLFIHIRKGTLPEWIYRKRSKYTADDSNSDLDLIEDERGGRRYEINGEMPPTRRTPTEADSDDDSDDGGVVIDIDPRPPYNRP